MGRGGEGETGEVRERVALRASIRGIKVTVQFDERRVQRGKRGGGLAAAVTSSFMNSLYFCSVQNKRTFLLKKMTKKYKTWLLVSYSSFDPIIMFFLNSIRLNANKFSDDQTRWVYLKHLKSIEFWNFGCKKLMKII